MYLHFFSIRYTASYTDDVLANMTDVYYHLSATPMYEMFKDMSDILSAYQESEKGVICTSELIHIPCKAMIRDALHLSGFVEQEVTTPFDIPLQSGERLLLTPFRGGSSLEFLYDHFFAEFDIEVVEEVERIHVDASSRPLLLLHVFGQEWALPYLSLSTVDYSVILTSFSSTVLLRWFRSKCAAGEYRNACHLLQSYPMGQAEDVKKEDNHAENPRDVKEDANANEDVKEDANANEDVKEDANEEQDAAALDHQEWVKLFLKLYVVPSTVDSEFPLLSTLYADYVTASGWTHTPTVHATAFHRMIRSFPFLTIKRKSKGMTLIGWKSIVSEVDTNAYVRTHSLSLPRLLYRVSSDVLVGDQALYYNEEDKGAWNTPTFQEHMVALLRQIEDIPYASEILLLIGHRIRGEDTDFYHTPLPILRMILRQFLSRPAHQTLLSVYKTYIDRLKSAAYKTYNDELKSTANDRSMYKFAPPSLQTYFQSAAEVYRYGSFFSPFSSTFCPPCPETCLPFRWMCKVPVTDDNSGDLLCMDIMRRSEVKRVIPSSLADPSTTFSWSAMGDYTPTTTFPPITDRNEDARKKYATYTTDELSLVCSFPTGLKTTEEVVLPNS